MKMIIQRLKEPSTYAGLSGLFLAVGLTVPEWYAPLTQALAGLAALAAMILAEKK